MEIVPFSRNLARLERRVVNRLAFRMMQLVPAWAVLVHHGRSTGREYRSPVAVFIRHGRYRIALSHGRESDWVRNVLMAGRFELEWNGRTVTMVEPILGSDPTFHWAPWSVRLLLRGTGAPDYLEARPVR
ncbi:nitroreductase/quinone reductase family protein [Nocardia sp. NPDC058058]|uniref:nitroreductase/quinone reductase family protein n=1 Tax=Nocardia sp. NPDC058058 TaxID=3346317 RepID=UPI0036DD677E